MRRLLALLLALPMAIMLAAVPAQADPTCPEGNMCFWTGYTYTGNRHLIGARDLVPPGTCALINRDNNAFAFRSFKNRVRDSVIAPAWAISNVTQCHYEKVLRYGEDLPRLFPVTNRPDYVSHYIRLR